MIVTTTETIEGRAITEYVGIVESRVFWSSGGIGNKGAEALFHKAMGSTKEILASVAAEKGADAVVGVRYHFVGKEIVSVGTAVKLLN